MHCINDSVQECMTQSRHARHCPNTDAQPLIEENMVHAGAALAEELPTGKTKIRKFENGFQIEDLSMGQPDGPLAKPGQKVFVKYRGSLTNGKVFDETKGKSTFGFRLGMCLSSVPSGVLSDTVVAEHIWSSQWNSMLR